MEKEKKEWKLCAAPRVLEKQNQGLYFSHAFGYHLGIRSMIERLIIYL